MFSPITDKLVSPDQLYVIKFNDLVDKFNFYVSKAVPVPGEIRQYAGSVAPDGWLACDGAAHSETAYPDLFGIVAHNYGADVAGTFRVPNFPPSLPIGAKLGGIEAGDVFVAHLPGNVDASFIAQNSSEEDVAAGLCTAITASAGYAGQAFTASYSAGSDAVYLTAKTPGQAFSGVSLTTATAPAYLSIASPVAAVAQVLTITVDGVVEAGDSYTAHLPGVDATYIAVGGDGLNQVAAGLSAAILASAGYAGQAFTAAAGDNWVALTAKVAGAGFSCTCSTANGGADGTQSATIAATVANVAAVAQVDAIVISPVKAEAWPGAIYIIKA